MLTDRLPHPSTPHWQTEIAAAITDPLLLCDLLGLSKEAQTDLGVHHNPSFACKVPWSFLKKMRPKSPHDPLLLQVLAREAEQVHVAGFTPDPLEERQHTPVPGLLHKYHGRALWILNGSCAIHCRYCFRRNFPYEEYAGKPKHQKVLDYLRAEPSIQEIILSGGDPLTFKDDYLESILRGLSSIPHLTRLRLHTRLPVVIPTRLTSKLKRILLNTSFKQVVLVLHVNHPQELDGEVGSRVSLFKKETSFTILNQSVLLGGINDCGPTLVQLSLRLFEQGILPYYLHQLDPVHGVSHFYVPESRAIQIYDHLQAHLPGYLVPKWVQEKAGARYKIQKAPVSDAT